MSSEARQVLNMAWVAGLGRTRQEKRAATGSRHSCPSVGFRVGESGSLWEREGCQRLIPESHILHGVCMGYTGIDWLC